MLTSAWLVTWFAAVPRPDTVLDEARAVEIALESNREIRARLEAIGIQQGRLVEAKTIGNPEIEAELLPERDSSIELRIEYDLSTLILAPLRTTAAESALQAERHQLAGEVVQLGFEVRSSFQALQAAEERFELARAALETFVLSRDLSSALHGAGNIPRLAEAERALGEERMRVSVAALELQVFEHREALYRLLGQHGAATEWRVARGLRRTSDPLPAMTDVERRAIEANHDLLALRRSLDSASEQTAVTRVKAWLPGLHVDVHALLGRPEGSDGNSSEWAFGGGLSLALPIFDRRQGELRANEAELSALSERYEGLAIDLRSAAREAAARLRSTHLVAQRFDDIILPKQKAQMEEALLQYNAMQIDVFQLLGHRRDQLEAEMAGVDARLAHAQARAAFEALMNGRAVKAAANSNTTMETSSARSEGGH